MTITMIEDTHIGTFYRPPFRDLDLHRVPSGKGPRDGQAATVAPRPSFPDAQLHAERLRALADSPVLHESIADWLGELARLIDSQR